MDRENKRRDAETRDTTYDDVYIERENSDGKIERMRIDKVYVNYSHALVMMLKHRKSGIFGPYRYSKPWFSLCIITDV